MNIEHLKLFVRLANTFNITQAGSELGLSAAVASAHINKLEQSLGVRLLHRTTRKVSLTEEGKAFLPHAEEVLGSIEAARAAVGAGDSSPKGTLRVTAPASFGRMHLIPAIKGFLDSYPELNIDLRLSDSIIDMVEGGFDVAIRNAGLKDSSLIARKLATDERILCASPDYIAQYGKPEKPEDLQQHLCIHILGLQSLSFKTEKGTQTIKTYARLRTDNGEAMRDASAAGLGISLNSKWSAYQLLREGKLVQVLEDYPLDSDAAIWALYPSSRL
jgi:DNA-binding transcriptional LysR family regulator